MKAYRFDHYGDASVLELTDLPLPTPADNEVRIRLHATSINDWDWAIIRGEFTNRVMNGLVRPKKRLTPGSDVAGVVDAVGTSVTRFSVGDAVYGDLCFHTFSCFAEYVCAPEDMLVLKPEAMTFEQAAAIPQAGMLALQGLQEAGLDRGQHVLLNGAGGGAGTFAMQIARRFDTHITVVDNATKIEALLALGADSAIDYEAEDFSQRIEAFDVIFDAKTTRGPRDVLRALKPGGTYATVGGQLHRLAQHYLASRRSSRKDGKRTKVVGLEPNSQLDFFNEQLEAGTVVPVIDGPCPFEELVSAMRRFAENRHFGKIVISFR